MNGRVVTELGTRVQPTRDAVELDGRPVAPARRRWILLNKPAGTLTTRSDSRGRPTVYDLLPAEMRGLRYVGRLDYDTEGLLLLTNEGDLAHKLMHPSGGVEREYHAGVEGFPDREALRGLTVGALLEDGPARAARVRVVGREAEGAVLALVLLEGRKREARRLLEAVGYPVRWLRRVRVGPLGLGTLRPGAWRELGKGEVARLAGAASAKSRPSGRTQGSGKERRRGPRGR